jgi:hypothetical protein
LADLVGDMAERSIEPLMMTLEPNRGSGPLPIVQVVDEAAVLRTDAQGATFQQVEGVRLLTFLREKPA